MCYSTKLRRNAQIIKALFYHFSFTIKTTASHPTPSDGCVTLHSDHLNSLFCRIYHPNMAARTDDCTEMQRYGRAIGRHEAENLVCGRRCRLANLFGCNGSSGNSNSDLPGCALYISLYW